MEAGVQVYGVSIDPVESHRKFREHLGLPFPLLADEDGTVSEAYDSVSGAGPVKYSSRKLVLIDRAGKVVYRDEAFEVGSDAAFDAVIAATAKL